MSETNTRESEFDAPDERSSGPEWDTTAGESGTSGGLSAEEQLRAEIQQLQDRWIRTEAEMDNVRRRARRDMEENAKFANQRLMVDLMEVVDNLHRALQVAGSAEAASLVTGVQMVVHQFEEVLKRHGCERVATVGHSFDPNFHEALQMVPSDSPPGSVVQEVRSGYRLHDRLIRPAQVIVAAG